MSEKSSLEERTAALNTGPAWNRGMPRGAWLGAGMLILFVSGLAGGKAILPSSSQLPPELSRTIEAFYRAIETDDHEARIRLFTENALMMPNHGARIEGKEAIAEVIRGGEGWVFRIRDREILDSDVDGHLAYTVNAYAYTYHAHGAEPTWHRTKNVHIWKREDDGAWKLHVDIWNADEG